MTRSADLSLDAPRRPAANVASALPVRAAGTRSRAGNAMNRARAALLDGAREAVAANGTRITMSQVATSAGVAKATLYNHFRTREAVLSALVTDEVTALADDCAGLPLAEALATAASRISTHPLLARLAAGEAATLVALARLDPAAEGWQLARAAVAGHLERAGRDGLPQVLRLLGSYLVSPGTQVEADVAALLAGLPAARGDGT
jgi:AcrR family transcriptional regulator